MRMQDLRIRATLDCFPGIQSEHKMFKITKGADAVLTYNLSKSCGVSSIEKIDQLTFIFKYNKYFVAYDMFDGELIDEHFSTLSKDDDIYVLFHFSSEETKELPVTEIDDGLLFEVVIKLRLLLFDDVVTVNPFESVTTMLYFENANGAVLV